MLKPTVRKVKAKITRVICQASTNLVFGIPTTTISWIIPASWSVQAGTPAIQPIVDDQPTAYESGFCRDGGANSDTQWYWPPLFGAIDAISAMEAMRPIMKNHTAIVVHMMPAVPPFRRPGQLASSVHSHVACRIVTNPTMETNLKLRWCTN
jgi:hypothetical protein